MKNTIVKIFTFVILACILCGCAKQPVDEPVDDIDDKYIDDQVPADDNADMEDGTVNAPIDYTNTVRFDSVVDANNRFAMDLFSRYRSNKGNIFYSPYSISSAMAMAYEGAKGETAKEMAFVMHLSDDLSKVHSGYQERNSFLNKADKKYQLSVANALWAQKDYPFVQEYFSAVETYYGGKATVLDFKTKTEESRKTINGWVEDKTNDRIKDLIPKGVVDPQTRLVITNAVYFKANWSDQFDADDTHDSQFYVSRDDTKTVKMMHRLGHYSYSETDGMQMLEMDYMGDDLSMLVILPKTDGLTALEDGFTIENLSEWKKALKDEEVALAMPKFKFETTYFMAEDFKALGMPTAFKYPEADFTAMSPTDELYIDEVIHKTFIEVAEYGTEAAAATAIVMRAGSMAPPPERKYFTADHPFIFIIQEKASGNILFMGRVSDPSS